MKQNSKQKILTYVQSGSLLKLKHYLVSCKKKNVSVDLNFRAGKLHQTPLHVACAFGDDAVVRCLIQFGARASEKDKNKDTPMHLAAKHILDSGSYASYKLLIDPLLKSFPEGLHVTNRIGHTPNGFLTCARDNLKQSQAPKSDETDEKVEKKPETDEKVDEKKPETEGLSWNEKLMNEWDADCADAGSAVSKLEDHEWNVPEYPTFEQWANRIAAEYQRKQKYSKSGQLKTGTSKRQKVMEMRAEGERLEKEREHYRRRVAANKIKTLESKHKQYQENISKHKSGDGDGERKLRFKDIPWPCLGTVKEMVEVIMAGSPSDAGTRRKFVLKQLVLWHPDKFLQRCSDIIDEQDRESIFDTVKLLSQALNTLLQSDNDDWQD